MHGSSPPFQRSERLFYPKYWRNPFAQPFFPSAEYRRRAVSTPELITETSHIYNQRGCAWQPHRLAGADVKAREIFWRRQSARDSTGERCGQREVAAVEFAVSRNPLQTNGWFPSGEFSRLNPNVWYDTKTRCTAFVQGEVPCHDLATEAYLRTIIWRLWLGGKYWLKDVGWVSLTDLWLFCLRTPWQRKEEEDEMLDVLCQSYCMQWFVCFRLLNNWGYYYYQIIFILFPQWHSNNFHKDTGLQNLYSLLVKLKKDEIQDTDEIHLYYTKFLILRS